MTAELPRDSAWAKAALKRYALGRFGQPEEIAAAILDLAGDEAGFVTGCWKRLGVALPADGGYTTG